MAEQGLLRKAEAIRAGAANAQSGDWNLGFDASSGISTEDQKDILRRIDLVAQSTRILAGPDTWKVRPRKRGFVLPLVINLIMGAVLVAGLFLLWRNYTASQSKARATEAQLSTAEGRLLQELRRESEGRIQEKDREIASIQEKMTALDKERARLLSSVEERVQARETELRRQLAEELERERQRLVAAGLTDSTIEERLKAFEREKTEALRKDLDEYARKAQEERTALQANLDKAHAEYQKSLAEATTERQGILEDSRRREEELRSQLDAKSKALEAERAKTQESLKDAQKELARLNADAAKAQSAEDRVLGSLATMRQALQEGRLDDAEKGASSLRDYLSDPALAGFPNIRRRRDTDLFTADLVERAVLAERSKSSVDTSRVSDALEAMGKVRREAVQAETALASGNPAGAEEAYRRLLGSSPEMAAALAFLDLRDRSARESQRESQNAAVLALYREVESAYAARDWASMDSAAGNLLKSLPLDEARAASALRYVKESGSAASLAALRASDTSSAETAMREAAVAARENRPLEAIQGYAAVLAKYPAAEQAPQALEGLRRAARQLAMAFQQYQERTQSEISALEAQLAAAQAEASAQTGARGGSGGVNSEDYAALRKEKEGLEALLAESRRKYEAIETAYAAFAKGEDAILSSGDSQAIVAGWSRMGEFLSNDAIEGAMPGLRARVTRYVEAFQSSGEGEVLFNASDIVEGAARIQDASVRERYFKDLEVRYADDQPMLEFLKTLRGIWE